MHIGFDAKRFFHNTTGLGNYSRNTIYGLLRHFPEHRYALYAARVREKICTNPLPSQTTLHEPCPPLSHVPSLWRMFGIPGAAAADRLDIYHGLSHELPVTSFAAPTKTVVTMHDMLFMTHPHLYPRLDRALYELKYRFSCKRADMVLAVSRKTAEDVCSLFRIPPDRVHVAYQSCNPAFEQRFDKNRRNVLRRQYDLPDEYILYVGSLIERKCVHILVRALARMSPQDRRPLLIVGTGSMRKELERSVVQLGITKLVRFLGRVPQTDLPGLYQNATVFVYPSTAEGFGIPILEGLVSGVPVITSEGSCFSEPGGDAALYTTPGNVDELNHALTRVLGNPELRRSMICRGFEHARQFSLEKTSTRLMDLYTRVLHG